MPGPTEDDDDVEMREQPRVSTPPAKSKLPLERPKDSGTQASYAALFENEDATKTFLAFCKEKLKKEQIESTPEGGLILKFSSKEDAKSFFTDAKKDNRNFICVPNPPRPDGKGNFLAIGGELYEGTLAEHKERLLKMLQETKNNPKLSQEIEASLKKIERAEAMSPSSRNELGPPPFSSDPRSDEHSIAMK